MVVALRPPRQLRDHARADQARGTSPDLRTCTIIADPHRPFREGVRTHLNFGFAIAGEAGSVSELAQAVAAADNVDLVLISQNLPGGGVAAAVKVIPSTARFVVFADETCDESVLEALDLGASGYLLKTIRATRLDETLRAVMGGEQALDHSVTGRLAAKLERRRRTHRFQLPSGERVVLTAREHEIGVRLCAGQSTRAIADELGISAVTARRHISVLMRKLHAENRAAAVQLIAG